MCALHPRVLRGLQELCQVATLRDFYRQVKSQNSKRHQRAGGAALRALTALAATQNISGERVARSEHRAPHLKTGPISESDRLGLGSLHPRSLCRRDRQGSLSLNSLKRLNSGSPSFAHSHIHDAHHDHQHEDEKSTRAAGGQADDHSGGELFRCMWRRGRRGRLGAGKNGRGQNGDPVFAARPSQISMGQQAGTRARDRGGGGRNVS